MIYIHSNKASEVVWESNKLLNINKYYYLRMGNITLLHIFTGEFLLLKVFVRRSHKRSEA
jgi:hypothetical protein